MQDDERTARAERIEALVARCEAIADRTVREPVLELLRLVLELHAAAARDLIAAVLDAPHLEAALNAWNRSPEVVAMLEIHDLREQLELAIERHRVRPNQTPDFVSVDALSGS